MKTLFSRSLLSGCISILMLVAGSQSLSAAELHVVGNLQANGRIQIVNDTMPAPLNLADTSYALLSGDTVKTGNGTAVLKISGMGRIGLAPDTEASVSGTDQGLDVDIKSGALGYVLTPGSAFTIKAADMTMRPTHSPVQKVSDSNLPQQVTGWVKIGKDGKVEVGAKNGRIEITHGGSVQVVESGKQAVLALQNGKLIATALTTLGSPPSLFGLSPTQFLAIAAVVGGGIAAGVTLTGNDNNPASP